MTGDIPSSGVTRSGMLLKSSSSELSLGGGYTGELWLVFMDCRMSSLVVRG